MNLNTGFIREDQTGKVTVSKVNDNYIQIDDIKGIGNYDSIKLSKEDLEKIILKALEWKVL